MKNSRPHRFAKRVALGSSTSAMPNDGQNRSLRSLFWPSCAGFHPELSAAARSARDIGHLRVCAAHSSSLNPFVKKMQAFSMTQGLRKPGARYLPCLILVKCGKIKEEMNKGKSSRWGRKSKNAKVRNPTGI